MSVIIVKNLTNEEIQLSDLGITIDKNSELNLTDYFTLSNIYESVDLKTYISNGILIINDGVEYLDSMDGLKHVTIETQYEDDLDIMGNKQDKIIIQVCNYMGGLCINEIDPIPIQFDAEIIKIEGYFLHDNLKNNSCIGFIEPGLYKIFYSINWMAVDGIVSVKTILRKNGNINIDSTCCYSTTDALSTNISYSFQHMNAGDYIEVIGIIERFKGIAVTLPDSCWINIERF